MAEGFSVALPIKGSNIRKVCIGNSQNQGRRPYQEDSFGFSALDTVSVTSKGFVAMVSDGMGGLTDSDTVSKYTVSSVQQMYTTMDFESAPHAFFAKMVNAISDAVVNEGIGGGATLVAVSCSENGIFWCSVGDSRLYLYRNGLLHQMTCDLDYIDTLLESVIDGKMTYSEADNSPKRDSLAQYIGSGETIVPDVNVRPFIPEKGDKLLLCSDGVYNALTAEEIIVHLGLDAQYSADALTAAVLSKQYENQDNLTSIVIEFF